MTVPKAKNEKVEINPYLLSSKAFHFEMPLYHKIDLAIDTVAQYVYKYVSYEGTIDAYCVWCKKESVFNNVKRIHVWPAQYETEFSAWMKESNGINDVTYSCTRKSGHTYTVLYLKDDSLFTKIGQWPSAADLQIPQVQKYRKTLGDSRYKELTRGIGLAAHGVGIGSFVYLRRIFEKLIDDAKLEAQSKNKKFSVDDWAKARMDERIKMVKDYLPEFLVENRSLYAILSKGIHELDENECLKYFETVKIGIEQILDEKIIQKERAEKAEKARKAIQQAHGKLNNS